MKKMIIMFLICCFTAASPKVCLNKDTSCKDDTPDNCAYDVSASCTKECEKYEASNCNPEKPPCLTSQCENTDNADTVCDKPACEVTNTDSAPAAEIDKPESEITADNEDSCEINELQNNSSENPACAGDSCGNENKNSENTLLSIIKELIGNGKNRVQNPANSDTAPKTDTSVDKDAQNTANNETAEITLSDEVYKVYELVNNERAKQGLSPLTYRTDLQSAADVRAREIVEYFSHTRPNGKSCFTAITESGISYTAVGENIAYGQRNAAEVMTGWMNSSGHRANILSKNYTGIAVGLYEKNGVKYWVQEFIK